jgi:RND superfamily putative drug exporter
MKLNPETIARASSRHPGRTVAIWLAILVAGVASLATLLGPALTTEFDFTNSPEAKRAQQILQERALEEDVVTETFVVVGESDGAVQDPAFAEQVNGLLDDLQALGPDTIQILPSEYPLSEDAASDPQVAALGPIPSADSSAVLFTAILAGDADEATAKHLEIEAVREATSGDGVEVFQLGQVSSSEDFKKISEEDLRFGEGIGVLAAIIVLVIVFGAVVAGLTPIVMGIFSIAVTLGIVGLIGTVWDFSFFTPNLISMMGLAVGIDYSLFIVSRYREERHKGREKLDAIAMAGATANRAVFFSGVTVVLALAGMLLVPTTIFRSLAGGAIIVVLVSVAASMTLLPAILSLLGDRVNAGRIFGRKREIEHGRPGGFWDRITRVVMARPVVWLVLGAAFMAILSLPYFLQGHPEDDGKGIKTGLAGIGTLPDDAQSKRAFNEIVSKFPKAGAQSTAEIVIVGEGSVGTPGPQPAAPGTLEPEYASAVEAMDASIAEDADLGQPAPALVSQDGTVAVVSVPLTGDATDAQSESAVAAIARLREQYVPEAFDGSPAQEVLVGGDPAFVKDFFDISDRYNLPIILLVLALSFVLLTIVFRSLVVPIKAIIMNLLSVGAAYGLIVLVFQRGGPEIGRWIADALGFQQVDAIEAWLPLFLFSILFGLSMDYHVFLISRIREEYDRTHDNAEAVAYGLRTTGGIITGAAVIMVAVFAGFAAGRLTSLEQMGFGLAVAVFMDATIVRSILVPSTMRLLGDRNWYLPGWLQWLPKVDVEGHIAADQAVVVPDTPAELVEADVKE